MKGKAGLGNRMLFTAHAVFYALVTRRVMIVDWSDYTYSHDGRNVFDELLQLHHIPKSNEAWSCLEALSVSPLIWRDHLTMSVGDRGDQLDAALSAGEKEHLLRGDPLDLDCAADVRVMWDYGHNIEGFPDRHKRAFFGTCSTDKILRILFRKYLQPSPEIVTQAEVFLERNQPLMGVHVRLSDKTTTVPLSRCFDRVDGLLAENNLFLSTDNRDVLDRFVARYGARVVSADKWYPKPGESAHQSKDCPDRLEHGREALIDMCILSRCKEFLRQEGSSFSLLADYLSARKSPAWNV